MPPVLKSSTGWYYGFKLHLAVNEKGEILGFYVTAANVDERETADWITQDLWGKLIGDKGYISQTLFDQLMVRGLKLITKLRRNMKNRLLEMEEKLLLRKRAIIETVNDQLKNISNIEHSPQSLAVELFRKSSIGTDSLHLEGKETVFESQLQRPCFLRWLTLIPN